MITQHILCLIAAAIITLLLFALLREKSSRIDCEQKDAIIQTLADQSEGQKKFYEQLLKEKNDSIRLLRAQVEILNDRTTLHDKVARLHGRGSASFENQTDIGKTDGKQE